MNPKTILKSIIVTLAVMFVLLITIANAIAFEVESPNQNITAYVGYEQQIVVPFFNNASEKLFNVTCTNSDEFKYASIELMPFEHRSLTMKYKTSSQYQKTNKQQTCSFMREIERVRDSTNTSTIMNQAGWTQTSINIYQDDILTINNTANQARTIEELNFGGSFSIPANSTYQFVRGTAGTYRLRDSLTTFVAYIYVGNKSTKDYTHNAADDITFNIEIESIFQQSSLMLEIFTPNISMEYSQVKQGTGRITNIGQYPLVSVELQGSDWMKFSAQNFSLAKDEERIFTFDIEPKNITRTDMTNKSYDMPITAKSSNSDPQTKAFSAFINYRDVNIISVNGSDIRVIFSIGTTTAYCNRPICTNLQDPMKDSCILESEKVACYGMINSILNNSDEATRRKYIPESIIRENSMCYMNMTPEKLEEFSKVAQYVAKITNVLVSTDEKMASVVVKVDEFGVKLDNSSSVTLQKLDSTEKYAKSADDNSKVLFTASLLLAAAAVFGLWYHNKGRDWVNHLMQKKSGKVVK